MPQAKRRQATPEEAPRPSPPPGARDAPSKNGGHTYSKRGEATFERVMRIVATMYRERGYERTSMSALARRAGLTAPAIYHYFGSKEEILAAFLDYTLRDLTNSVQLVDPRQDVERKAAELHEGAGALAAAADAFPGGL